MWLRIVCGAPLGVDLGADACRRPRPARGGGRGGRSGPRSACPATRWTSSTSNSDACRRPRGCAAACRRPGRRSPRRTACGRGRAPRRVGLRRGSSTSRDAPRARRTRCRRAGSRRRGPRPSWSRSPGTRSAPVRPRIVLVAATRRARRRARPAFVPRAAAVALLGERVLEAGEVDAHAVLGRQLDGQVDREAVRVVEPERDVARAAPGASAGGGPPGGRRRAPRRSAGSAPPRAGPTPASSVRLNWRSSRSMTPRTSSRRSAQVRVGVGHRVDDDLGRLAEERLRAPEQAAVADGAAQDPAQHVAAALVRRQHAVGDEERHRAAVVGDDLVAEALLLERRPGRGRGARASGRGSGRTGPCRSCWSRPGRRSATRSRPMPVSTPGRRQRRQAAVRVELELHEHEVPDLEPARAVLAVVRDALGALGQVGAAVVVELRARAARPDVGHAPPVLLVAGREVAPADEALRRQADLVLPDGVGDVVGRVHGRGEPVRRGCRGRGSGTATPSGSRRA